jgi:hypothetical protein
MFAITRLLVVQAPVHSVITLFFLVYLRVVGVFVAFFHLLSVDAGSLLAKVVALRDQN